VPDGSGHLCVGWGVTDGLNLSRTRALLPVTKVRPPVCSCTVRSIGPRRVRSCPCLRTGGRWRRPSRPVRTSGSAGPDPSSLGGVRRGTPRRWRARLAGDRSGPSRMTGRRRGRPLGIRGSAGLCRWSLLSKFRCEVRALLIDGCVPSAPPTNTEGHLNDVQTKAAACSRSHGVNGGSWQAASQPTARKCYALGDHV
jgi:hypothetical protein